MGTGVWSPAASPPALWFAPLYTSEYAHCNTLSTTVWTQNPCPSARSVAGAGFVRRVIRRQNLRTRQR